MGFEIPALPYAYDALEPYMSARTLQLHYEKHHKGYGEKLEAAVEGKPEAEKSLAELIRTASERRVQQRRPGLEPHLLLAEPKSRGRR